jgi:hypothetical protein
VKQNGCVLWTGPSKIDGGPIMAIAVGLRTGSTNRKTGAMLQTYILRADAGPLEAIRSGADASICGSCPLRGTAGKGRGCYVNIGQGPRAVHKAYQAGQYSPAEPAAVGKGRAVRIGTYGDPGAVPSAVWRELVSEASMWTGYTHRALDVGADLVGLCMASVSTPDEATALQTLGWRTFRAAGPAQGPSSVEVECPAYTHGVSCADCGLCDGTRNSTRGTARSVMVRAHGIGRRIAGQIAEGV